MVRRLLLLASISLTTLYCRYFYVLDGQDLPHVVCGFVRDVATNVLRERHKIVVSDVWCDQIKLMPNRSTAGFLVEEGVLSSIISAGLTVSQLSLPSALQFLSFNEDKSLPQMLVQDISKPKLLRPTRWNYPACDFIAVTAQPAVAATAAPAATAAASRLDTKESPQYDITICVAQITIGSVARHEHSIYDWCCRSERWRRELNGLSRAVKSIRWKWVWIVDEIPTDKTAAASDVYNWEPIATRTSVHVPISLEKVFVPLGTVSVKLSDALKQFEANAGLSYMPRWCR